MMTTMIQRVDDSMMIDKKAPFERMNVGENEENGSGKKTLKESLSRPSILNSQFSDPQFNLC